MEKLKTYRFVVSETSIGFVSIQAENEHDARKRIGEKEGVTNFFETARAIGELVDIK